MLGGEDITQLKPGAMWPHRKRIQTIFQDPYSSMNPRLPAGTIVGEPLENFGIAHGTERDERVAALFERVGLRPDAMRKYAHEFSGGQRQRLGIAKALSVNPDVIVADEPVSALDVSVQAQVLNLLIDLQDEYGLAYLFISHDLAVMRHISHRIAVMYLGRIVELTDKRTLFARPLHPYTEALLSAATAPDPHAQAPRKTIVQGDVPSPANPPPGCHFHTRCPYAVRRMQGDDAAAARGGARPSRRLPPAVIPPCAKRGEVPRRGGGVMGNTCGGCCLHHISAIRTWSDRSDAELRPQPSSEF